MKKKSVVILLGMLFHFVTIAQKYDNNWLMGYGGLGSTGNFGGFTINFNANPPDTMRADRAMEQGSFNNNISDKSGNLLFYSNGCAIAGQDDELLSNGDSINVGEVFDGWCDTDYPLAQSGLIFPDFVSENIYHFFYLHASLPAILGPIVDGIWYAKVDMNGDAGKGEVVVKNEVILADTLDFGQFTATRHANGRDWWMVARQFEQSKYSTFLFSPVGITNHETQDFNRDLEDTNGVNQAVFSPDGSKYIRYDHRNDLHIFDFDRCSGTMSNPVYIDLGLSNDLDAGGVAVSSNSRYLYLTTVIYAYQFDLWADDIEGSKILVAEYDGFTSPFNTTFFLSQLAPDNKIYINTTSGTNYLHIIHEPNKEGLDCNFEQHAFKLPAYNANSMPNFPNYRLGPLVGSACDSLFLNTSSPNNKLNLQLFPNPTIDKCTFSFQKSLSENIEIVIVDLNGKIIINDKLPKGIKIYDIYLDKFGAGIYFYHLSHRKRIFQSGKIVAQ